MPCLQLLVKDLIDGLKAKPGNALIIVGHQPILGWIAEALCGEGHPIENAELLCLRFRGEPEPRGRWQHNGLLVDRRAVLRWVLTPAVATDKRAMVDLKDKIRGKMEGAKLLGTFIAAILGFMLTMLGDPDKLVAFEQRHRLALYVSAALLTLAAGLYFASYYAYDRLLMPIRFWGESRSKGRHPDWLVLRPPSSALWVLYQNMLHVWTWFFTPAMVLVYGGLVLLAVAVFQAPGGWVEWTVVALLPALAFRSAYKAWGPRLGAQD